MTPRPEAIASGNNLLDPQDECWNLLEYTSHGRRTAGNTNQLIGNLQKSLNASPRELGYKQEAIKECGEMIAEVLGSEANQWTIVPMPCSKPNGHPEYDDRLEKVLKVATSLRPDLSVQAMLETWVARPKQKHGQRLTVAQLQATMRLKQQFIATQGPPNILLFDDVFTRGASFKAAQGLLANKLGVTHVSGLFIAKTVHPNVPP